jgi:hypothetical protein
MSRIKNMAYDTFNEGHTGSIMCMVDRQKYDNHGKKSLLIAIYFELKYEED